MSIVLYVALVTGDQAAGYRATFVDIADCEAAGADLPGLLVNGREVLAARLEAFVAAGDAWPAPTPIEQITIAPGALPIPIDVSVDDPPIRVNISLGERLVQRLDAAAESRGMTRSGFIAQSVRATLGEAARPGGDYEAAGRRLQDELSALGRRIHDSIGPESPFGRRLNDLDDMAYDGVRKAADAVAAAVNRKRETTRTDNRAAPEQPPVDDKPI